MPTFQFYSFRALRYAAVYAFLVIAADTATAAPKVITSIKPIYAITAAIMAGTGEAELLITNNVSPHDFQLQPSTALQLQQADLVIWVGPALESRLTKPLLNLTQIGQRLTLLEQPLPVRLFIEGTEPQITDPHIWLHPENAIAISKSIADTLSTLDPSNKIHYQQNLRAVTAAITTADQQLRIRLMPLQSHHFVLIHDNIRYFTSHYRLNSGTALNITDHRPAGAKTLITFKQQLRSGNVECLFYDMETSPKLVKLLLEDSDTRAALIDPLGTTLPTAGIHYPFILNNLADTLISCLAPQHAQSPVSSAQPAENHSAVLSVR